MHRGQSAFCAFFLNKGFMGRYIRWQVIIAFLGIVLLALYLNSIHIQTVTVKVPAEHGTYREGNIGGVQYLNPLLAEYNPIDKDASALIFDGLTRIDGNGKLVPALAENLSVSADGRVYTFIIRDGVTWHDGTPFSVDDVSFTLSLIRGNDFPGNPAWHNLWRSIEIEIVDKRTIRFVLQEPLPTFLYYTTIGILPKHLLVGVSGQKLLTDTFNLAPIGTGAFKVQKLNTKDLLLTRNLNYWNKTGRIDRIDFKFYNTADALLAAWARGKIDGVGHISSDTLSALQARPDAQLFSASLPQLGVLYFNLQQPDALPFFQDANIRQALGMLINRNEMIATALNGQAIPAESPFLPSSWAFDPAQTYPKNDPLQAHALLLAAGWIDSDGDGVRDNGQIPFAFTLLTSDDPAQQKVAAYLADVWGKAGIAVTVESVADGFQTRLQTHNFQSALLDIDLFGDPDPYRFWHQSQIESGQNFGGWDNTPASIALEQARTILNQNLRREQYYKFQQIFAEDSPALVLYNKVYTFILRDSVKNAQMSPLTTTADRFQNFDDWYLIRSQTIESPAP